MRTVRSQSLVLKSGRERIYELQLVELDRADDARFLVNYRYGWVGSELQEGTRTPDAVTLSAAEKIFDSLILSRRNQGYEDAGSAAAWGSSAGAAPEAVRDDLDHPRSARLLYLLGRLTSFPDEAAAKLIWRTGQVRLAQAAPILAAYVRDAEMAAARVLPYALYRCGKSEPDVVLPALQSLSGADDPVVATPAGVALSLLSEPQAEAARLRSGLPDRVRTALDGPDRDAAVSEILGYLQIAVTAAGSPNSADSTNGADQQRALMDLYLLSRHAPQTRAIFLRVLELVPFKPFLFRAVRRVYKAAEAADDAEAIGLFCHRFDTEPPAVNTSYGHIYVAALGQYMAREEALGREDARVAWSGKTRTYFRRRIWRQLRRIGALDDPAYVDLAAACLMRADEKDSTAFATTRRDWATAATTEQHYPAMARRFAVHNILHGNGARLAYSGGDTLMWRFVAPAASEATDREEPFAHLWDAAPDRVLSLLVKAKSEQVFAFASRILKDNQAFCLALPVALLARLVTTEGQARFNFALETVRAQFSDGHIDAEIIPALFRANRPPSLELGQTILNARPHLATSDSRVAAELIFSVRNETKDWFDRFWSTHANAADGQGVLAEVIKHASVHAWLSDEVDQDKHNVRLAAELLSAHFAEAIRAAPLQDLVTLSKTPHTPAKLLAVLLAAARPDGLTAFDPNELAQSDDPDLQAAGAELLANAEPAELARHEDLVAAFLVSPVERARKVSRNAALAIAEQDTAAAGRIAMKLLEVLYRAEQYEGVRDDVVATMQGPLLDAIRAQGPDLTWSLLRARSEPARRVGAASLEGFQPAAFSLRKIARIANNDQVSARQWSLAALEQRIGEVRAAPQEVFSLLDGEWDDSREAAYDLIRTQLVAEDWTPEAVVGLCDCTTLPAQRFGQEILGTMFSKENSQYFLMRLSEHPAAGFRLIIARLIREYAAGDPGRIRKVEPALSTILSRVFTSRAAKDQIHRFVEDEIGRGDPETLEILSDLLERVSATCAVADKARVINHIAQLKAQAPNLVPAASIIVPEVRGGTGEAA